MVSYLDAYKFNAGVAQQGLQQMEQDKYKEAVGQAANLWQAGDMKGAATTLFKANPELATQTFEKLFTTLNPELQGQIRGAQTEGQLASQSRHGSTPRQLLDAQIEAGKFEKTAGASNGRVPATKFEAAADSEQGKAFAKLQDNALKVDDNLQNIDEAITSLTNYYSKSPGGTGPLATLGGFTKYLSKDTQELNSKFKRINLQQLTTMFQGMSKAVDSQVERQAFEAQTPSITNEDKVNASLLLGAKSLAIKGRAEAAAQREWVKEHGNLREYKSPILGKTKTIVSPEGEMELVPSTEYKQALEDGYLDLDTFAKTQILRLKKTGIQRETKDPSGETELQKAAKQLLEERKKGKSK